MKNTTAAATVIAIDLSAATQAALWAEFDAAATPATNPYDAETDLVNFLLWEGENTDDSDDEASTVTATVVEFKACRRCRGTGFVRGYEYNQGGRCFACN